MLWEAGLIVARRRGRFIFYSPLDDPAVASALVSLDAVAAQKGGDGA